MKPSLQYPALWDADMFSANQKYLSAFTAYVKYRLRTSYPEYQHERTPIVCAEHESTLEEYQKAVPGGTPIDYLVVLYGLSVFEKNVLLLCVLPDLDSSFLNPFSEEQSIVINFSLAMAIFPDPEWGAMSAASSLRKYGLIYLENEESLTQSRLRVPESVVHFIAGISGEDPALSALGEQVVADNITLDIKNREIIEDMRQLWMTRKKTPSALYTMTGQNTEIKRQIAAEMAKHLNLSLRVLPSLFIPYDMNELRKFSVNWNREIILNKYLLMVETDRFEDDAEQERRIDMFLSYLHTSVLCSSEGKRLHCSKDQYAFDIGLPTIAEQKEFWNTCLNNPEMDTQIKEVCSHFELGFHDIQRIAIAYKSFSHENSLWSVCRRLNQEKVGSLAEKIEPSEGALHLILPPAQQSILDEIISHVKLRSTVYDDWGFSNNSSRGGGISVLFAGSSGTGKTTAAEYLALKLELDLYRIDLSSIVSKYIGETEKNLQQIFSSAEKSGAILLFDEADALFSKRTKVSDSLDKYANSQVSYLLQRIESYKGLAILTTNLKSSFDNAFIRRLRFVVEFTFPTAEERRQIWESVIPGNTPVKKLDFEKLSQLNVAGGNIRNIAMNACFMAAAESQPLQMKHFLKATRREYAKQEMTITAQEVMGWE